MKLHIPVNPDWGRPVQRVCARQHGEGPRLVYGKDLGRDFSGRTFYSRRHQNNPTQHAKNEGPFQLIARIIRIVPLTNMSIVDSDLIEFLQFIKDTLILTAQVASQVFCSFNWATFWSLIWSFFRTSTYTLTASPLLQTCQANSRTSIRMSAKGSFQCLKPWPRSTSGWWACSALPEASTPKANVRLVSKLFQDMFKLIHFQNQHRYVKNWVESDTCIDLIFPSILHYWIPSCQSHYVQKGKSPYCHRSVLQ